VLAGLGQKMTHDEQGPFLSAQYAEAMRYMDNAQIPSRRGAAGFGGNKRADPAKRKGWRGFLKYFFILLTFGIQICYFKRTFNLYSF